MEWTFKIEQLTDTKIKIIDNFDLSAWSYSVRVGLKWYSVFIDSPEIELNRNISKYFLEIKEYNEANPDNQKIPEICVSIDLNEYKKLCRIDKLNPGSAIVSPTMPFGDVERLEKLEKELNMKQKQLVMLSTKMDNLENLLKKSIGL